MKRKIALGLTLAVLASGLAGCGNAAPQASGTGGAAKSEELYSWWFLPKGQNILTGAMQG